MLSVSEQRTKHEITPTKLWEFFQAMHRTILCNLLQFGNFEQCCVAALRYCSIGIENKSPKQEKPTNCGTEAAYVLDTF